ncbi:MULTISPECIES: hypothetical protein [unclassified Curtobacterium]|uniref:hypothetical protein n=1 Tax=unclassified Curtobacterium TaxID=257496 RepID=UPI000F913845|nr:MULTISPECIES: hypothetical protein [unclassified Curtobacterium]ROQ29475.1 hypothetical protein EDF40_0712 [Curtobacterium sp. PhB170]
MFSGPLASPRVLAEYERLVPGAILISTGHTVGALAAIVPGVLGAASQVVAAARRGV